MRNHESLTDGRCMKSSSPYFFFFFFFVDREIRRKASAVLSSNSRVRVRSVPKSPFTAAAINFISIQLATVNRLERANCVCIYIYINLYAYIQGERRPWLRGLSIISDKFIRNRGWPICFNSVINHWTTLVPYLRHSSPNGWFASVMIPSQIQIIKVK